MNRVTRLFGDVFLRNFRCINQAVYLSNIVLRSRHISTTTNHFLYYSWKINSSSSTSRKLCDVPSVTCWKCNYSYLANADGEAVFFCSSCNVIQEPVSNRTYFDILNCKHTFDLDTKFLTKQFRNLQSQLHPDKFSLKSEREQDLSSLQSSHVNEAYQMLLKPLARGLYLLELEGNPVEEGKVGSDVVFLSEIMEMNETLEDGTEETLRKLRSKIEENLKLCTENASEAFNRRDFDAAKEILSKMKYYDNISEQIREKSMG